MNIKLSGKHLIHFISWLHQSGLSKRTEFIELIHNTHEREGGYIRITHINSRYSQVGNPE